MASRKRSIIESNGSDDIHNNAVLNKELDEVSCPICMDHPHNAVLLLCSSHEKGCRSYICDTSYRHSNCLDRYRKLASDNMKSPLPTNEEGSSITSGGNNIRRLELQEGILEIGMEPNNFVGSTSLGKSSLRCPLCRGTVLGGKVMEEARKYLNAKPRNCSRESCSFSGNYRELRRHARRVHPASRPADTDPSRQRAWRRLEHQREYGDIVSAIRSAMPGAIVLGDYVVENGDNNNRAQNERGHRESNRPWLTTFFLFQMIGAMDQVAEPRGGGSRSRVWRRNRQRLTGGPLSGRRYMWGENLLGLQDNNNDDDDGNNNNNNNNNNIDSNTLSSSDTVAEDDSFPGIPRPRRRRRLTRYRSDQDQS